MANSVNDPLALTGLEWGAHDVLGKPISFDSVRGRVDALLRRQKSFPGHAWAAAAIGGVVTVRRSGRGRPKQREVKQMDQAPAAGIPAIDDIIDNFSLLDEWDDRYRYVIELGRGMSPLPEIHRCDANKVQGCASQVWLGNDGPFRRRTAGA